MCTSLKAGCSKSIFRWLGREPCGRWLTVCWSSNWTMRSHCPFLTPVPGEVCFTTAALCAHRSSPLVTAVSEQKNVSKEPSSAVRRGRWGDRGSTGLSLRASVRLRDQLSLGAAPALPAWEFNQRNNSRPPRRGSGASKCAVSGSVPGQPVPGMWPGLLEIC